LDVVVHVLAAHGADAQVIARPNYHAQKGATMTDDEWQRQWDRRMRRDRITQTVLGVIVSAALVVSLWFVVNAINNTEVEPGNDGCHTERCVERQYEQLDPPMGP
jgi:hypothetical protein